MASWRAYKNGSSLIRIADERHVCQVRGISVHLFLPQLIPGPPVTDFIIGPPTQVMRRIRRISEVEALPALQRQSIRHATTHSRLFETPEVLLKPHTLKRLRVVHHQDVDSDYQPKTLRLLT